MADAEAERLFEKGLEALATGNTLSALSCFEKALQIEDRPEYSSHFAFCAAKERGQVQLAVTLCEKAIVREKENSVHYLNLGRIYLIAGRKADAIRVFRSGLEIEADRDIIEELNRLGTRKPPALPFLKRSNPINKYLGILIRRSRLR